MRDLAKSQSRLRMSGPPHQPRARASGPRCRRCLPRPPAPAATAGRPVGSARRLHPRDAVAERFLDRYVFRCTHPPRPSNLRCAAQLLPSETPPPAQGRHHQTLPHGRAASSVCRSARPGPLAAASILLGVNRGYKGLYGGGWPLRGMGAAGTALGAADARTNEHYEIGTILTQKSQGVWEVIWNTRGKRIHRVG